MAEEGRVYTTCDDDHFLLTEDEAYEEFAQGRFVVDALNETDEAHGSTLDEDTQHNKTKEVNTALTEMIFEYTHGYLYTYLHAACNLLETRHAKGI